LWIGAAAHKANWNFTVRAKETFLKNWQEDISANDKKHVFEYPTKMGKRLTEVNSDEVSSTLSNVRIDRKLRLTPTIVDCLLLQNESD